MKIRGNTVGTPLSIEKIKEEISTALIVALTSFSDPMTASHSAIEITRHLDKGPVIFMSEWDFIKLNNIRNEFNGDSFAIFKTAADENGVWKEYTIDDYKNVTVKEMSFATKGQIGNIETALDAIIEIQNQLIGGDA